ncbi:uncharacterized protein LOC141719364 [Apium graveolens]|uniref:uncharacterized protein LOC141719364 n=1 Tax=Apium graveolens TaxID=4045 RepID=UPI003D7BD14C
MGNLWGTTSNQACVIQASYGVGNTVFTLFLLRVRVTRLWSTISPETVSIKGYNLILLDDDNSHVHAYVYLDTWTVIGNGVVEGNCYTVENFQVRDTIGRLKPMLLVLLNHLSKQSKYLHDLVKATLESHRVSIWGELAKTVNEDFHNIIETPVIAVVTSTKLTLFRNELQNGTLPSSKVYLNLDWEDVNELRQRLEEEGYKPNEGSNIIANMQPIEAILEKVSLKDFSNNIAAYFAQKVAIVTFTVIKIEDEDNWWYNSCNNCHTEVEKIEKKYRCMQCKRNFPYSEKRFRLFILADDNAFACNMILMDRVVKRIVGTTVTNLLNESKKAPLNNFMPTTLIDIAGKEITVKLSLTEANINGDSNVFKAVDLYDMPVMEKVMKYSPITKCPSFNQYEIMDGIELFDTPGSSTSVSKKIKKDPWYDVLLHLCTLLSKALR